MNYYQADQEILEDNVYKYGLWDLNRILVEIEKSYYDLESEVRVEKGRK